MVMGPNARTLLSRLTDDDLSRAAAPWMSARELVLAGVPVTALRVSFVGELGWELHVADRHLVGLYDALWGAGADLGLGDFGSYALNAMRIEKGYHGWGSEFGVEYTPFDVGLDRFLALDKLEFVGRDAVLAVADGPAAWSYGVWTVDVSSMPGPVGDPPPSAPIRIGGQPVGFVTSSSMGFRTGRRVCLGYVEGRHAATTAGFTIDGYGADLPAERHASGIYDPEHHRPRG